MREIKFRAWDKKMSWLASVVCLNMGTWIDIILQHPKSEIGETYAQTTENVIIEQFTGLHDKNGKEIYEGDIVNVSVLGERVVRYSTKQCAFKYYLLEYNHSSDMLKTDVENGDELIGSIHDEVKK
jgi:uncharacterized phage protein (TIGR01671 family)